MIHVVLVSPAIPHNTGCIGRLCLNFGAKLHLVGPLGFTLDDKMLKRAGLDYWQYVDLAVYPEWKNFVALNTELKNRFFFSKFGNISLKDIQFYSPNNDLQRRKKKEDIMIIFGSESKGLFTLIGEEEMKGHSIVTLPVSTHRKEDIGSLNLSTCVAMGLWEAWKQCEQWNDNNRE